jgi:hypothetical protein
LSELRREVLQHLRIALNEGHDGVFRTRGIAADLLDEAHHLRCDVALPAVLQARRSRLQVIAELTVVDACEVIADRLSDGTRVQISRHRLLGDVLDGIEHNVPFLPRRDAASRVLSTRPLRRLESTCREQAGLGAFLRELARMNTGRAVLAAITLVAIAACSGGKSGSASSPPPAQASPVAATPASSLCGGSAPVWALPALKVYLEPGDRMYGRTKNGRYLCPSKANAEGYRPARRPHDR